MLSQDTNKTNHNIIKTKEESTASASIIIKMLLCAFFWGGTFIAGKISAPYASPSIVGFLRFGVASIVLVAMLSTHGGLHMLTKKQFFGVAILAFTGIFAYGIFFIFGLSTVPASRASLIVANNPLLIALGATLFLKEKLSRLQVCGIFLSITGAAIIITNGNFSTLFNNLSYGDIAILCCAFSWATYSLIGKVVLKTLSPLVAVTWACILGTFMFLPVAIYDGFLYDFTSYPSDLWLAALYLGVFGTALGFVWFYEAVKLLGAAKSAVFINFVPVAGVLLSAIFLGEHITLTMILGGMFTISGVYLTNRK